MTTALTTSRVLLAKDGMAFTSTGFEVSEGFTPTAEEWLQAGLSFRQFVSTIDAAVALCYGDWLNLGEQVLGEDFAQGFEAVLPINPDDWQLQRAEKTIYQYRRLARETPKWMRGLPGLSARHYLNAIRITDHHERYEHLIQASVEGWSVRRASQELPALNTDQPAPATRDDLNHQLLVENGHLQRELDAHRALMDEASGNIEQARDILEGVVETLPTEQAQQVQRALEYLGPVVVRSEFVELVGQVIDLYDMGDMAAMVEVMERLREMRREMLSARADTIVVNGRLENRGEWLGSEEQG